MGIIVSALLSCVEDLVSKCKSVSDPVPGSRLQQCGLVMVVINIDQMVK